ncbi:MAG: AAA family ATPase [bacterium]|nr:AAA family ATPase [bacterium]
MPHLDRIKIAGFKSIRDQDIELGALNVLIGANGAGKSNFIGVFRLLNEIVKDNLQVSLAKGAGADQLLHFGGKTTEEINLHLWFGPNAYACKLVPTSSDSLIFGDETVFFQGRGYSTPFDRFLGSGHKETALYETNRSTPSHRIAKYVLLAFKSWKVYHFHDTSSSAKIKGKGNVDDNRILRPDAGNLAAFLYLLQETQPAILQNIVDTIRMVTPFFDTFNLQPDRLNPRKIKLEWHERGSDGYFDGHALSDGTLRFICLATLLMQPELPTTILVDEPELGLHPYAVTVLAELLRSAATRTQVVVSTQSVTLVNQLSPEDILIVDREGGESIFRRLEEGDLAAWMEDYALGDLWEKNVIGGRPHP